MLNIKDIKYGDKLRWIDGHGFEVEHEVMEADDGCKMVHLPRPYAVSSLLIIHDNVEIIPPESNCHICGCKGGH